MTHSGYKWRSHTYWKHTFSHSNEKLKKHGEIIHLWTWFEKFNGVLFKFLNQIWHYRIPYYFWQWQLINYWDDCHLELIPRPSSATEMNFQSVFECENAWSGARNRIRKERFSGTKLLNAQMEHRCQAFSPSSTLTSQCLVQ